MSYSSEQYGIKLCPCGSIENHIHCWNCGRRHGSVTICACGIDLWAYPHKVPVVKDDLYIGTYHVAGGVSSQFRYAMRARKPELLP
jgi:hypothetical protein